MSLSKDEILQKVRLVRAALAGHGGAAARQAFRDLMTDYSKLYATIHQTELEDAGDSEGTPT